MGEAIDGCKVEFETASNASRRRHDAILDVVERCRLHQEMRRIERAIGGKHLDMVRCFSREGQMAMDLGIDMKRYAIAAPNCRGSQRRRHGVAAYRRRIDTDDVDGLAL